MFHKRHHFLFPKAQSTVLPDPSGFFSEKLVSNPLPTNSFFQNLVLKNGDQPEYMHPYLVKSSNSSLSVCYPSRFVDPAFIYQIFNADLSVSVAGDQARRFSSNHVVSSFDDLSVTLDIPSPNLQALLVRGSPFVTFRVQGRLSVSTIHAFDPEPSKHSGTKHKFTLNNGQTWVVYASSPISFSSDGVSRLNSDGVFSGILRISVLPNLEKEFESVLDEFSSCYPVSGEALFDKHGLEYKWKKERDGELLMLAHPLHLKLLSPNNCKVLEGVKYKSIDGELVGVVGDSWSLRPESVPISWCSINNLMEGLSDDFKAEIKSALKKDVDALNPSTITTTSSYFYGKLVARAARLAMIAEEVCYKEIIPEVVKFLKNTVEPWLTGSFGANGFLYDEKWGGIVTKQGLVDSGADFGFGIYNDHHYHLGYFLYAIAVLAKLDRSWGKKYRAHAYSMVSDFMTMEKGGSSHYPKLRCFDLYKLHSWAGGLTEFADGRNQESTSEAVNAYYSAALLGIAYDDDKLLSAGTVLTSLEIAAAKQWWQVKEGGQVYDSQFTNENRVVGVLWANKRDSGLWFAPPAWRECRLGIQLLPLLPITEKLFSDPEFAKQLVEWTEPALGREDVGEGWKGFVYSLQGVYDWKGSLERIRGLSGFDDGNSLSNLLWWVFSRRGLEGKRC